MIYRTDVEHGGVYQPLDWKLYTGEGQRVQLDSEEALREFLKSHPDRDFFLVPGPFFNRQLQGREADTLDPQEDHIRCGIVRYDSASQKVMTRDSLKVTYSDEAKRWGEGFVLLQQATKRLEEALGRSAPWVVATWGRTEDARGRPLYTLRLSDWVGTVSATFTREELQAACHDLYRWHRLWGDLLQARSERQLFQLASGGVQVGE